MDMPESEEKLEEFKSQLEQDIPIYPVSSITRGGLKEALFAIADILETIPKDDTPVEEVEERVVYRFEKEETPFEITRESDGAFVLKGPKIEKLFKMTNFDRDESVSRFSRQLRTMGVDDALRKRGAKDGDTIRLLDFEFEFVE
jgi:GTP-binding protein